ncbi:MAG: histidine kinase dimerization/phospho-acceptor domain-containing protein [bacterium]|nr:histidine kinase dimerization/phospho-acceptor domain-containing protein [bacterium]
MDQDILDKLVRKTGHDVRTPITTIAGFADLLAEDRSLPEGARDIAATIVTETRRLSDMLETFFDEIGAGSET